MLEARVNKQEIKRQREKRKRDEKLGREKKIENNRGKRTQKKYCISIIYFTLGGTKCDNRSFFYTEIVVHHMNSWPECVTCNDSKADCGVRYLILNTHSMPCDFGSMYR